MTIYSTKMYDLEQILLPFLVSKFSFIHSLDSNLLNNSIATIVVERRILAVINICFPLPITNGKYSIFIHFIKSYKICIKC